MKYTKEERMDIARQVYDGKLTVAAAAVRYDVDLSTIKGYVRLYRETNGLPPRTRQKRVVTPAYMENETDMKEYEAMSKEELLDALVTARINEARLKKGYFVKGDGAKKEFFVPIDNKNIK